MSNTYDPPTLRLANTPPPEPDPLDTVPTPQELRPRLAEMLRRTDALRRLIRVSEKLHRPAMCAQRPAMRNTEGAIDDQA